MPLSQLRKECQALPKQFSQSCDKMQQLNDEIVDLQQRLNITVDWDQTSIADQVMVLQVGNLTRLTISDTGLPTKKV